MKEQALAFMGDVVISICKQDKRLALSNNLTNAVKREENKPVFYSDMDLLKFIQTTLKQVSDED